VLIAGQIGFPAATRPPALSSPLNIRTAFGLQAANVYKNSLARSYFAVAVVIIIVAVKT
jgi:hypothetical protein